MLCRASVSCGAYHTLILLANGGVLGCGANNDGILGRGSSSLAGGADGSVGGGADADDDFGIEGDLPLLSAVSVFTSRSSDSEVSNSLGNATVSMSHPAGSSAATAGVGLGRESSSSGRSVSASLISAGGSHNLGLSRKNGALYAWGVGSWGRLGLADSRARHMPTRVRSVDHLAPILDASAGYEHSV